MRMLDEIRDQSVSVITILLTREEAEELRDSVASILGDRIGRHEHISSQDFQKEITIAVYDDATIESFNERCRRLIREDR